MAAKNVPYYTVNIQARDVARAIEADEDEMTSWRKIGAGAIGATCVLLLAACDDEPRQAGERPVQVGVVEIAPKDLAVSTDLSGRVAAVRVSEVRPQVSGIVKRRLFEEGSNVKAGEQLYQIDSDRYAANLASAEADLARARANLKSVQARAERYAALVKVNAVSKQDYDDAVASLDQARADVKAGAATLDLASIDLVYTRVNAPISGRIGKSSVTEGALVTANQAEALATVTQLDPIYVDLTRSSVEMLKLRREVEAGRVDGHAAAARVSVTVDGDDAPYPETGILQFSDVTVDQSTGMVTVRAVFPNPRHELLPGMFVRARVAQGVRKDALTVPQQALIRDAAGGAGVWMADAAGKAVMRPVTVSHLVGGAWVVEDGLSAGDRVIVDGLQNLRPGVAVEPVPAEPAAKVANR